MDFVLAGLDLDDLILSQRNKLWNDKRKLSARLGMDTDNNMSSDVPVPYPQTVKQDINCNQVPSIEDSACLGRCQRKYNNTCKEISSPTLSSEPRMRTMVRHGEYSPLNPNFLSPGKFMLGLGEYEERRRLLMAQKKHEYKEHLSQVRMLVHSRNGNPSTTRLDHSETNQKPHSPFHEDKSWELPNNKHIQVPVSEELPDTLDHQNILTSNAATITTPKHSSIGIQTPSTSMGIFTEEPPSPKHSLFASWDVDNQARLKLSTPDVNGTQNQAALLNPLSVENLSPRDRKLADLKVSEQLSKMFFETSQETNPTLTSTTNFQARRQSHSEIYKEELRQQIEAKRKLDNELREKEKREEEAINRRVEEQQERIRLEYLKEEAKKLTHQKQRLSDFEEYPDQQQKCTREIKSCHEIPLPRQINLETYYPDQKLEQPITSESAVNNSSNSVQSIQPNSQLKQASRQSINTSENHIPTKVTEQQVNNTMQLPPTRPFRSKSFTVIDSTISNEGSSFLKPPVDADSNRLWKPTDRNMQMKSCKTCNFEDSLPIPLFRSKSPVNLPMEISGSNTVIQNRLSNNIKPANSQAMKKLEAKWQVPAVEKNNITRTTHQGPGGGQQKNVLTQLGAFRRQLQLEQMQTEGLKKVNLQRTKMK